MDSLEDELLERAKDSISTLVFSDFTQLPSTIGEVYWMERPWVHSDTGLVEVSFLFLPCSYRS